MFWYLFCADDLTQLNLMQSARLEFKRTTNTLEEVALETKMRARNACHSVERALQNLHNIVEVEEMLDDIKMFFQRLKHS